MAVTFTVTCGAGAAWLALADTPVALPAAPLDGAAFGVAESSVALIATGEGGV